MKGNNRRRYERYRVHLRVRFSRAEEFVEQYAENLSYGGLFIQGVDTVGQLEEVLLDIELPGHGSHRIKGMVAHVVPHAGGEQRAPGVGIQIMEEPPEFRRALDRYLQLLGARRAERVIVSESVWAARIVQDGGYQAVCATAPGVEEALGAGRYPLAVACGEADFDDYRAALGAAGTLLPIIVAGANPDAVLARLDEALAARRGR